MDSLLSKNLPLYDSLESGLWHSLNTFGSKASMPSEMTGMYSLSLLIGIVLKDAHFIEQ